MNLRNKIIISCIITTLIVVFTYLMIRTESYEKVYLNSILESNKKIGLYLDKFQKEKNLKDKDLSLFVQLIRKKFNNTAFIALTDGENNILKKDISDLHSESTDFFNKIITSSVSNSKETDINFITRYNNGTKYYILTGNVKDGRLITISPYIVNDTMKYKFILEVMLILIGSIILHSLIYIYQQKKGNIVDEKLYNVVNMDISKKSVPAENEIVKDVEKAAGESLNRYVYDTFVKISEKYFPETISLYINNNAEILEKKYELKGNTFFKIDSKDFDIIELENEIGYELKNSSIMVLDNSRTIIIPLLYRQSLIGAVIIVNKDSCSGHDVNSIKHELGDMAKYLSEYILMNDIVVDKDSGLYSKSYFNFKYDELKKYYVSQNRDFAVFLVSAKDPVDLLNSEELNLLGKKVSEKITEKLNSDFIISKNPDHYSILVPKTDKNRAAKIAGDILNALASLKIKIGNKLLPDLKPCIGFISTDSIEKDEDPLEIAKNNLEYAMSKEMSNFQSARFKEI